MPTDDYIKRSDCLEAMKKAERWWWNADDLRQYHEIIESIPAADVEPKRKTGKWINHTKPDADNNVMCWCSECGAGDQHAVGVEVPYCWKCGAKMQDSTRGKHVGEMLDRIINQYMQKEEPHD